MLQKRSVITLADNSGVLTARIMQIYSGFNKYARLGQFIRVVTRTIRKQVRTKKVRARRLHRIIFKKRRRMATLIRVKRMLNYLDGTVVNFNSNSVLFYRKKKTLKGKRFFGLTTRKLPVKKLLRRFKLYI